MRVPTYQASDGWVSPNETQVRAPDVSTGLNDLAQGVGQAGSAANAIVDMSAQTVARQQSLADTQALSKLTSQYATLQGQNAVNAQKDTLAQIQAVQDAGAKAMPNGLAQRYYQIHSGPVFAGANDVVNDHAVKQTHAAFGDQLTAERSAAQDSAAGLYQDVDKLGTGLGAVADKARSEAMFNGLGDANSTAVSEYVKNKTGEVISGAIHNALSSDITANGRSGVDLAIDLNNRFGGDKLPFAIQQQVEAAMKEPLLNREASAYVAAAKNGPTLPVKGDDGHWVIPPSDPTAPGAAPSSVADPATTSYQMPVAGKIGQTEAQHEARGSEGIDIPVPVGTAVKAPAQGVVSQAGYDPRSGNFVVIDHPDGSTSTLAHFSNLQVKTGDQVNANTVLGASGQSGDATGPHVHWQLIDKNDNFVDPASVVGGKPGAVAAVTSPGSVVVPDESRVLANVDAMNLPPEMATRVKALASQQFKQARTAQSYQFEQASQNATEWVANWALAHNNEYPPATAIPPAILAQMRPDEAASLQFKVSKARQDDLEAASDKAKSDAQTTRYADLQVMRYDHPDQFLATDPRAIIGQVSAGQWNEIRVSQAEMRAQQTAAANKPQPFDPFTGASSALQVYQKFNPDVLPDQTSNHDAYIQQRAALLDGIRARAVDYVATKHAKPSSADWNSFAQEAAHQTATIPGVFYGSTVKPAYQVQGSDVPGPIRATILQSYAKAHPGQTPTEQEIADRYRLLQR